MALIYEIETSRKHQQKDVESTPPTWNATIICLIIKEEKF
jgi:hypothetical protein